MVQTVPGVSMRTSGGGQTELEMRGMTSSGGNSSTVGFYLDDTPLTAPSSAQNGKVVIDPNLYDLNRIEVLRGPQGTLYGSGSMGGTIKLVPNAPDPNEFDASGELIFGGTDGGDSLNHTENAMVNLPLGDTAALRIVGSVEHLTGWIDRIVIARATFPAPTASMPRATPGQCAAAPVAANFHDVNNENLRSVRAALLWNATDRLSIEPSFMYQELTQGGLSLIDSNPGTQANYQPFDLAEPFEDRIGIGSIKINFHFDFADLTSASSYWSRDENLRQDGSEEIGSFCSSTAISPFSRYTPTPVPHSPTPVEDDGRSRWSEEIRLASSGDTDFKWLVGYFYQDFESQWNLFVPTPDAAPTFGHWKWLHADISRKRSCRTRSSAKLSYTLLQSTDGDGGRAPLLLSRHGEYRGVGMAQLLGQR